VTSPCRKDVAAGEGILALLYLLKKSGPLLGMFVGGDYAAAPWHPLLWEILYL
jgi:hypothetical protein